MKNPSSIMMIVSIILCFCLGIYSLITVNSTNGAPKQEHSNVTFLTRKIYTGPYDFTEVFKVKDAETGKTYIVNSAGGIIEESVE